MTAGAGRGVAPITPEDIRDGRLLVSFGMARLGPAEFVVLGFYRLMALARVRFR